jgi:hypothetical protein
LQLVEAANAARQTVASRAADAGAAAVGTAAAAAVLQCYLQILLAAEHCL